jgi:hypothetical protein
MTGLSGSSPGRAMASRAGRKERRRWASSTGAAQVGERWGDGMTDLLGDRNTRAPNAAAEAGHSGGARVRRALAPGRFGDLGARVGAVGGGLLGGAVGYGLGNVLGVGTGTAGAGAPLVTTPGGVMAGASVGAVGGMAVGSQVDRALERLDGVRRRLFGSEH